MKGIILLSVPTGSITCYTVPSVAGEFNCLLSTSSFYAATIEECCDVGHSGYFFEGEGDESCQACIGMKRIFFYQKCLSWVYIQLSMVLNNFKAHLLVYDAESE